MPCPERGVDTSSGPIEKQYRLNEGGVWPSGTSPGGYDQLRQPYQRAWDEVFAKGLEKYGEPYIPLE